MNDFSLHSNLGGYVSDSGLSGIHPESPYIRIEWLRTSTPINTKHVTKVSDWTKPANYGLEEMQSYPACPEPQGTLPRAGFAPLNPAGAHCIKSYPKNLEKLLRFGAKLKPSPCSNISLL